MSDDMKTKYQQHYNQILTGTLTENIMKSISYQANIKLANEIIAEQEKTITDLQSQIETIKTESESRVQQANQQLESFKNNKVNSDTVRITSLENTIKSHVETITKLNGELFAANKLKNEFEILKNQANNGDVFRKELIKERENHAATKQHYENSIIELNEQIESLKAPPKRKKIVKKPDVLELVGLVNDSEVIENTEETTKDGGTF